MAVSPGAPVPAVDPGQGGVQLLLAASEPLGGGQEEVEARRSGVGVEQIAGEIEGVPAPPGLQVEVEGATGADPVGVAAGVPPRVGAGGVDPRLGDGPIEAGQGLVAPPGRDKPLDNGRVPGVLPPGEQLDGAVDVAVEVGQFEEHGSQLETGAIALRLRLLRSGVDDAAVRRHPLAPQGGEEVVQGDVGPAG